MSVARAEPSTPSRAEQPGSVKRWAGAGSAGRIPPPFPLARRHVAGEDPDMALEALLQFPCPLLRLQQPPLSRRKDRSQERLLPRPSSKPIQECRYSIALLLPATIIRNLPARQPDRSPYDLKSRRSCWLAQYRWLDSIRRKIGTHLLAWFLPKQTGDTYIPTNRQ